MRGVLCVGLASFFSIAALILLIFVHIGQVNTSTVPHAISMATINTSGYGAALASAFLVPIADLYATNASSPLGSGQGLRDTYSWGLYGYCAGATVSVSSTTSNTSSSSSTNSTTQFYTSYLCTPSTPGHSFNPYTALTSDMAANYTQYTAAILSGTSLLKDEGEIGEATKVGYWFLLVGTALAFLAAVSGMIIHTITFPLATVASILAALCTLIGAALWTALIQRATGINSLTVGGGSASTNGTGGGLVSVGIDVSMGDGIYLAWAAFACLVVSVGPYMISCCTYRG